MEAVTLLDILPPAPPVQTKRKFVLKYIELDPIEAKLPGVTGTDKVSP